MSTQSPAKQTPHARLRKASQHLERVARGLEAGGLKSDEKSRAKLERIARDLLAMAKPVPSKEELRAKKDLERVARYLQANAAKKDAETRARLKGISQVIRKLIKVPFPPHDFPKP